MKDKQLVLTIDLEDWFHSLDPVPSNWKNYDRRIDYSAKLILDLLAEKNSKATFFILGDVAKYHTDLIRHIHSMEHEIGSHGLNHKFIYNQSKEEFRDDIGKSISILSDVIGESITSYRAPYFSITKKSLWAFDILSEEGIKIDSSIFPIFNHRYGIPDNSRLPYQMENGLWEWPITTYKTFLSNLPFAGGVYFRFLPIWLTNYFLASLSKNNEPILMYFHPWEFDPEQPKLKNLPMFLKFRHYYNLKKNYNKLNSLLENYDGITLSEGIKKIEQRKI